MGFNRNAKLIPLVVFVLGLAAALGMYWRIEKMGQFASTAVVQAPTHAPRAVPTLTPVPTSTSYLWFAALNTVYNGVAEEGGIHWNDNVKGHDPKLQAWMDREVGTSSPTTTNFTLSILGSTSQIEEGVLKEYFLTQAQHDECNAVACGAILGGAVLAQVNNQWQIESVQQYIASGGWTGKFWDPPTSMDIGKGKVAFVLDNRDIGTGFYFGTHTVYAYVNGAFRNVLEAGFSDNRGSFEGRPGEPATRSTDTTFDPIKSEQQFYDIKVTSIGTEYSTNWKKPGDFVEFKVKRVTRTANMFSFDGDKYVAKS